MKKTQENTGAHSSWSNSIFTTTALLLRGSSGNTLRSSTVYQTWPAQGPHSWATWYRVAAAAYVCGKPNGAAASKVLEHYHALYRERRLWRGGGCVRAQQGAAALQQAEKALQDNKLSNKSYSLAQQGHAPTGPSMNMPNSTKRSVRAMSKSAPTIVCASTSPSRKPTKLVALFVATGWCSSALL